MYSKSLHLWAAAHLQLILVSAVTYTVPASPPANASAQIDPAPVGVSLEFFAFPGYINNVASTQVCLQNLKNLTGTWPPLRIGGTTQDRATYDASSSNAVTYSVASPADAPASLTYGPSFITLAGQYGGKVTLGLNRRLNNQPNTIAAATLAISNIPTLDSIELGNEPNLFTASDPIAGGSWNSAKDYSSQVSWQTAIGTNMSVTNIFSAGVFLGTSYKNQGLANVEGSAIQYVKNFCSHNYPQSKNTANLASLMSHSSIKSQVAQYAPEASAAAAGGKPYVMGETNSATQGGGGISPTFGAGLWLLDYVFNLLHLGVKSIYFHQGTIGNCQYCWWGRYNIGAPYYGAYFATLALAGADRIAPLDTAGTQLGAWAIYENNAAVRVLLLNSNYYTSGTRPSEPFTLAGLSTSSVTAKRLTAPFATSRQDRGQIPTFGGQTFKDGTCAIQGTAVTESATVSAGRATFTVGASEALLVYL